MSLVLNPRTEVRSASCCDVFSGDDGAKGKGDELSFTFLLWDGGDMTSFDPKPLLSSVPCLSEDTLRKNHLKIRKKFTKIIL